MSHGSSFTPALSPSQVRAKYIDGTARRRRAASRAQGDVPAVVRLRQAMQDIGWVPADIAAAWGIDERAVRNVLACDAPLHAGDLECLGALFDRWCFLAIEERKDRRQIERSVATARLVAVTGRLQADAGEALADGVIDDAEQEQLARDGVAVVDAIRGLR